MNDSELQPPPSHPPPAGREGSARQDRRVVLVCEDEPALRELVRVSLGDGYAFLEASDGDEALGLLRSDRPDLLVLDLMLPRRSGLEVLEELRRTAAPTATIVLTAQPDYAERARELGADRVISKPFLPDELAAVARELLAEPR
jgi:DNA-binding response OmpR family regulator